MITEMDIKQFDYQLYKLPSNSGNNNSVKSQSDNKLTNKDYLSNTKNQSEVNKASEGFMAVLKQEFNLINKIELKFNKDLDTGQTYLKILDKETGETIREIPPEEVRKLAQKLEEMVGLLFDKRL